MKEGLRQPEQVKAYFDQRIERFDEILFTEAINAREKVEEIQHIGNIDLLYNAHALINHIIFGEEKELIDFARKEAVAWAQNSIGLSFKIKWVQAIRRTIWIFIEEYQEKDADENSGIGDFFFLERIINKQIDLFLNEFFIMYSDYKENLLLEQRKTVEELSVPIIPIDKHTSVLPLIGKIDALRASVMLEKVLHCVGETQVRTMIVDLSSIAEMEAMVVDNMMKMVNSLHLMGTRVVMTGMRPEVARQMIQLGISFGTRVKMYGTLQQALGQCPNQ